MTDLAELTREETGYAVSTEPSSTRKAPTILIADDDDAVRMLIRACLEAHGYRVVEATHGAQALELFTQHEPSLVMLDVVMPNLDGFAACRQLRQMPGAQFVPVVMMTGLDDTDSIEQAYEAGATDFVTKPVHFGLLPHRVSYLFRAGETLRALRQSERRLTSAQHLARLGSWELDLDTRRLEVSREAAAVLGLDPEAPCDTLEQLVARVPQDERERVWHGLQTGPVSDGPFGIEHRVRLPDHSERIVYQQVELHRAGAQEHLVLVGMAQDITERSEAEKKIFDLAHYDPLTGLANRTLFRKRAAAAIQHASDEAQPLAILSIGLDRFQRINETCGHDGGDQLLTTIGERLEALIPSEETRATAARLGGDEFVLCRPVNDAASAELMARNVLEACARPVDVGLDQVNVSASVGIAVFPDHGADVFRLLEKSDAAMHRAKAPGGDALELYDEAVDATNRERLALENGLRHAIDDGDIEVWYQPKVDLGIGAVAGLEALARWRHAARGLVPPDEFIGLAEETGLIEPLGRQVLERACAELASWQQSGHDLTVAVNLSPNQFNDSRLAESIVATLDRHGLESSRLEVEITESALMADAGSCSEALSTLQAAGVRIAVDDFGTGYASLSYLKRFPIDTVKIDRSFVADVTSNTESAAIVEAILGMSQALDKRVVAEGVEDDTQLDFLRGRGCDHVQGYYFARPMPAAEMTAWLDERGRESA